MPAEDEARAASRQFYAALNSVVNGDAGPMADVWSRGAEATAMHPLGGRQVGWEDVWASWQQIAGITSCGSVALEDQLIRTIGEAVYEFGTERVDAMVAGKPVRWRIRVTNVYQREAGAWRIIHHHTDAVPEMPGGPGAGSS